MKSPFAEEWKKAKFDEIKSFTDRKVWDLVPRPPHANVISCKWVYKTNQDAEVNIIKHKARLVARGFT